MKAVLLAGGKGTRLKPYTISFPKPLVPVGDKPIMEIVVCQLAKIDIDEIIITTGHLAELIQSFFGNGAKYGTNISYSKENEPLGTVGPLVLVKEKLSETFILMNGDILTDIDYNSVIEYHKKHGGLGTIVTVRRNTKQDYGVIISSPENKITDWQEKPIITQEVSTGIYILEPDIIELIPEGVPFDFPNLILKAISKGEAIYTYPFDGYWLDIGRKEDYEIACRDIETMKERF